MNANKTSAMFYATSTNTGAYFRSPSEQPTSVHIRDLKSVDQHLNFFPSATNDGPIETLSKPIEPSRTKAPSTFTSPIADKQLVPAELLAEWSGCVTSVPEDGYYFLATLKGIKGEGVKGEEDDATIPMSDVSEYDKDLLQPGNFFRLCVMHEVSRSGQPRRYSLVVFRRLPAYRKQDLDEALERGRKLARGLRVE